MKNLTYAISIAIISVSIFGCSICCSPYDFDYPTYGGKFQRSDPVHGRVGSPFSDPGSLAVGPDADSNLSESDSSRLRETQSEEIFDLEDIDRMLEDGDLNDELGPQIEKLPAPQPETDESTALRSWRQRPLRKGDQWR